ncbi:MAG TPA: TraR/DksA family transcriptional regulator [Balneolaceae bacterium]|nr:TraR/DksA family transcriptional regulator [Balneolaceae bacterium]
MGTATKIGKKKVKEYPFSEEELNYFENLLLKKRKEALHEFEAIRKNIENHRDVDDADQSSITHHQGDLGSNMEEQDLNYQFLERTRRYIQQLDRALMRIKRGTYGICVATGEPIEKGRLEIVPHTNYSVDAKLKGLKRRN